MMYRFFIGTLAALVCNCNLALAQKPSVKCNINDALLINFPVKPETIQKGDFSIFYAASDGVEYMVHVNNSVYFVPMTRQQFDSTMQRLGDLYLANGQWHLYAHSAVDTFLGGIRGRFIRAWDIINIGDVKEMFVFITLQESKSYFVQCNIMKDTARSHADAASFYKTMRFIGTPYVVYEEPTPLWVSYLVYAGLLALAFIIFVRIRSNRRARRKACLGDAFR
ncbi:MAG TPA: hypothetical protein VD993_18590 [Chitinophagaceae bacterium]|nr:hypothetical protein [Chitinophagaceae bacterium]